MLPFAVILPAAGQSSRFGQTNKLLVPLRGDPVIAHSLRAFLARSDVPLIVIPTHLHDKITACAPMDVKDAIAAHRIRFCPGGASRAHSVQAALQHVPPSIEWIAVHDAARPLVSQELIDRTLALAHERGAAVPALPVTLTIKSAAGPLPARVTRTIPRDTLWAMQTPQIMRRAELDRAFAGCPIPLENVTDDAQFLELAGLETWLTPGDERNIKITTATDLRLAEILGEDG
jgi:2-C-methyl-D-erythritol 4-phosphate cytidylyltransferase